MKRGIPETACWGIVLVVAGVFGAPEQADSQSLTYDFYDRGIHLAEFSVLGDTTASAHFTVRRRDLRNGTWGTTVAVPRDGQLDNPELGVGSLGNFARLGTISEIEWSALRVVAWPDAGHVYVRHREFTKLVDGVAVAATRWAVPNQSNPIDLIVGQGNRLIAAIFPRSDHVLVRRGFERFTSVHDWNRSTISPAVHGYRQLPDVTMRARDGTKLATLVYLPDGPDSEGPFPTIFIRTPYGITNLIDAYENYPARGYALVLQATRASAYWDPQNQSGGIWNPMVAEAADGADALEWIANQPWSDGGVCMEGGSYVAYTQWTASMAGHPALKCLIPNSSMGTAFSDQPYRGGGFVEGLAYYVFWMLDKEILPDRNWSDILHHRPLIDIDHYATGEDIGQWNTLLEHWRNDEYWQREDWYRVPGPRNFATLQISGWFDDDVTGTQSNWDLMSRTSSEPQRMILGPWKHGFNSDRSLNGFHFGIDAIRDDIWLLKQQWYDRFLRDVENGVDDKKVEYFLLGSNEWRAAEEWPPREAVRQSFFFHSDGNAGRLTNRGTLSEVAPSGSEPPDEYRYDPTTPPANWRSFDLMESWEDVQRFPYDFKDIEARPDVVTFTSDPLAADLSLAGFIEVELFASTDVLDTDWWVHLSDVHPDDTSVLLSTGMLRARFRDLEDPIHQLAGSNIETESLLIRDLGDVVRYHFTIPAIANTFKAGHRVRVAIMNAMDNYSFPNSNTGGDEATVTETVVGKMRIHHSAEHPSRVTLHILPNHSRE
jgi:putative CocE/NonD family hydrolase